MSFKENLLTKIKIDRLAAKVMASIGPAESGSKVDKEAMRQLMEMSPYVHQKERDLDLYVEPISEEQKKILVLDSELPIYRTTIEDVTIRKSPLIKEMVKIRNINSQFKIKGTLTETKKQYLWGWSSRHLRIGLGTGQQGFRH